MAFRDSKDPAGPKLCFAPAAWPGFVDGVRGRPRRRRVQVIQAPEVSQYV
ncbi:DUF397 domain-containing protein [Actinomadura sp. 7K507]|nr:DUF397 domain-containing protein [Actinomadura sp. 7K507]